jgi:hypothetical protein
MPEIALWEYRVESFGSTFKRTSDEDLMTALDEWGEQGWEVVSVVPHENTNRLTVVARRTLTRTARRERSMPSST